MADISTFIDEFLKSDDYFAILEYRSKLQSNIQGDAQIKIQAELVDRIAANTLLTKGLFHQDGSIQISTILAAISAYHRWLENHYDISEKK